MHQPTQNPQLNRREVAIYMHEKIIPVVKHNMFYYDVHYDNDNAGAEAQAAVDKLSTLINRQPSDFDNLVQTVEMLRNIIFEQDERIRLLEGLI